MHPQQVGLFARLRGAWWRRSGEHALVTTFWPQDYVREAEALVGGQAYHITRYVRAADPRFFEVWGRPVPQAIRTQERTASGPRTSLSAQPG